MAATLQITDEAFRLKLCASGETPAPLTRLHAARRDTAAFQLIVQSDHQYSVNTGRGYWVCVKNEWLEGAHEYLRAELRAPFPASMSIEEFVTDDDELEKADLLLADEVRESRAHLPTAVWAEIAVPEDADPGDYPVEVRLYSRSGLDDETLVRRETLTLSVADVTLAPPAEWSFRLDLWQHTSNIARRHDVPLWSDAHFDVLRNYAESLAALGQKSVTVVASEIPWRGQSCHREHRYGGNLYEYSMIGITRGTDGALRYDYSAMQRYIDLCTAAGITGDIEVIGLVNVWFVPDPKAIPTFPEAPLCPDYPEPIRLRYYDEADGCIKYVRQREEICDYVRALEDYFVRTGQIGRVRIAADEPGDIEKYRRSLALLAELAPRFRCKTAINHAEFIEEFHDRIDDFAPFLRCAVVEHERLQQYRREYPDKRFLWYVCCGRGVPNTFLRSPLVESRVIGVLTSAFRLDGFLRWAYTAWPGDPRVDARYSAFDAGDCFFVYPAKNGGVLLSLRYKNLQRGIADFELLERLRREKGDAAADEILASLLRTKDFRDFWRGDEELLPAESLYSLDWRDYDAAKARVLELLGA
ncbi:MAG: DUF4091 domain-containing protein [Eubacteriales bacterium]|nr:DUF4091 domain-containing protein [Eubacteriales bacterium]